MACAEDKPKWTSRYAFPSTPSTRLTRKYLLLILEIFKEKEEGKIRSLSCQKREAVNNCN